VSLKIIAVFLRSSATVWLSSTRWARTFDTVRSYHWRALPQGRAEVEPLLIIGTGMGSYSVELLWHTGPAMGEWDRGTSASFKVQLAPRSHPTAGPRGEFPGSIRLVIPQNEALSGENWRTLEQT
jgi:hypothetical protein